MEQRVSLITLGVNDLAASIAFFERLGWTRQAKQFDGVAFFQLGSIVLSLYPFEKLAEDARVPADRSGFDGITIAHNCRSKAGVDEVLAEAEAAGGTIVKPAEDVFWGGYSGYFRDPDGHLWEVAWNPFLPIDEDGGVHLQD
jgi:catechol 2,3-dioxygenase-like lactoylglutathione lyase family enzyme